MSVIDCVTFNGEQDLWDIHYNILKPYVDQFIVLEFNKTFSGRAKTRTFSHIPYDKVAYHFVDESVYDKYMDLALSSPNTQGADHWKLEFCQKESIKDYLTHLRGDDVVFIGDVDEVVEPYYYLFPPEKLTKYKLEVYAYYLNNKSNEQFWGTISAKYKDIKNECLNHLRSSKENNTEKNCGWHFTSMASDLRKKLEDSYTKETYANDLVMSNLDESIKQNKDFLGRDFTYTIDESDWPLWIKEHREEYSHMLK